MTFCSRLIIFLSFLLFWINSIKSQDLFNFRSVLKDTVISCKGLPVNLNDNPDTNFVYLWSPVSGLNDSTSSNPIAIVKQTSIYEVKIFNKVGQLLDKKIVTVFVPPAIKLKCNQDTVLCYTQRLELQATTDPFVLIEWRDESDNLLGTGYNLEREFKDSMFVFAYAIDIYGCGDMDSFRIIPIETTYRITGNSNLCPGENGIIEIVNLDSHIYKFDWTPQRFIISNPNQSRILVKPTDTTVFNLTFINEYGCAYKDSFKLNINDSAPLLQAFADPDTIYLGESAQLSATLGFRNYLWLIPYNLDCSECVNPIASPERSTLYNLIATYEDGCKTNTEVSVIVLRSECDETTVYIPNLFRPNNGDSLKILGNFLISGELYIYDSKSQLVFETKDINKGWDGKHNGIDANSGIFSYYFNVTCVDGQKYSKRGNTVLFR